MVLRRGVAVMRGVASDVRVGMVVRLQRLLRQALRAPGLHAASRRTARVRAHRLLRAKAVPLQRRATPRATAALMLRRGGAAAIAQRCCVRRAAPPILR